MNSGSWFEGPGWKVLLPEALSTRLLPQPPSDTDITSMGIARGWVGDTPVTVIITDRPLAGRRLESFAQGQIDSFEQPVERRQVSVGDSAVGLLVRGSRYVEEGVVLDGYEQVTLVVVPARKRLATLAVRVPLEAPLDEEVAAIVASFTVTSGE